MIATGMLMGMRSRRRRLPQNYAAFDWCHPLSGIYLEADDFRPMTHSARQTSPREMHALAIYRPPAGDIPILLYEFSLWVSETELRWILAASRSPSHDQGTEGRRPTLASIGFAWRRKNKSLLEP